MRRACILSAAVLLSSVASNAYGIVRRNDVADTSYRALGDSLPSTGFIITDTFSSGSGVLISPQWVLTAAHVVDTAADATVVFGSAGLNGWAAGTGYEINQIVIHPGFSS